MLRETGEPSFLSIRHGIVEDARPVVLLPPALLPVGFAAELETEA
jgi:hypothetical protein